LIPLRDENPTELTPYITIALIVLNVLVWLYLEGGGLREDILAETICRYGLIPAEVTGRTGPYRGVELGPGLLCPFGGLRGEAVLTSMFLHGSWLHLIFNMWFLWLFGNNVEDSMGHLRFLLFYLLVGVGAAGTHIASGPESPIPTVGASGAISGVMGAYLVLYPRVRIHTLFIFLFFVRIIPLSAWFVLVYWFVLQVVSGISIQAAARGAPAGGVAFWAHAGGFVAGVLLVKLFENRTLVEARKRKVKLSPWELPHRGWW